MRGIRIGAVVVATLALLPIGSGRASSPWHQITASNGTNNDEVALLRTSDSTLHIVWHRQSGPETYDMLQTPISRTGQVGSPSTIVSGWASLENPALAPGPGGAIQVFFGGIRSINPGETNSDLNLATSTDGGATWALQPGDAAAPGAAAYSSPVGAAGASTGPYETWFGTSGVWVHAGSTPATPDFDYQSPFGCCGYESNLAADAAGHVVVTWYSNASGHLGVYAQPVAPAGSPLGNPANMPSTGNMNVGQLGRTPLVARPGGGFYIAYATGYPSLNRIRVWQVGAPAAHLIASIPSSGGEAAATIAATPDGRLWVLWKRNVRDRPHLFAVRSNPAVTRWGAVVDGGAPPGATSSYLVDANSAGGALDAFGSFTIGSSGSVATWFRRILPGLALAAKPGGLHRGHPTSLAVVVSDAGAPIKGAKVRVAGHSAITNAKGRVTFHLSARHPLTVVGTAPGYTGASIRLNVG